MRRRDASSASRFPTRGPRCRAICFARTTLTWAGAGAGVGLVIVLVVLVLVPVMPFTEQYARQSRPQAYWASPTFKKINRVLSVAWGWPS
jgi:hypothetical protein